MEYFIKASLVIALFYLCYITLLKRETFFEHNRWFLLSGFVIALLFPLVVIPIEIPIEPVAYSYSEIAPVMSNEVQLVTGQLNSQWDWTIILPIIYTIGLVIFLVKFMLQFGSLALLLFNNPKQRDGFYTYVIIKSKIAPFSFFKWIVFNPKAYSNEELNMMLAHEKVHVNQLHSVDIIFTELICALFWLNPFVWFYKRDIKQNLEYIADFNTQNSINNHKGYQRLLLKTSIACQQSALTNNFYNSLIKKRIVMLQKSKSKSNKKWRYALMLPIVLGLLLSMNTKEVYVETESYMDTATTESVEFVVTKDSSAEDLKWMTDAIERKGGTLIFKDIQRNAKNEITSIFVKLHNHSYGGGDAKNPIDSFIIYKEYFGNGGGFVGRPGAATMHFDNKEAYDEVVYKHLEDRAVKAMTKLGLDLTPKKVKKKTKSKTIKRSNSQSKGQSQTRAQSQTRSQAQTVVKGQQQNVNQTVVRGYSTELIEVKITKNTTKSELESIVSEFKTKGVTLKIKGVKRNSKEEITAIKIDAKSNTSSTNYSIKSDNGIAPIVIGYNASNGQLVIGNQDKKAYKVYRTDASYAYTIDSDDKDTKKKVIIGKMKGGDKKIKVISGSASDVNVIHEDDIEVIVETLDESSDLNIGNGKVLEIIKEEDGQAVKLIMEDSNDFDVEEEVIVNGDKVKVIKKNISKKIVISDQDEDEQVIVLNNDDYDNKLIINDKNGKSPLYMVDGKEYSKKQMKDLDPKNIKSLTVIKGEKAIEAYGKKAKDGAIVIETKKED